MNQPPRTRPASPQRPPAPRRRVPPPPPRRQVPWVSLTIWGLVIGVLAGIYIQISRWLQPMFDTPPPPPFLAEAPLNTAPSSGADSEDSQTDTASNADSSTASSDTPSEETASATAVSPATDAPSAEAPPEPEPVTSTTTATRGRVIEPIGLAIRADPSVEAAYLGGIAFNETVTILESSGDGRWQRVRRDFNGLEGWIKAGNVVEIE